MAEPPTRTRSVGSPSTTTPSSSLPVSRLPIVPARSSDHAALSVAATSASSSVMSMAKQARGMANGIDEDKPAPGGRAGGGAPGGGGGGPRAGAAGGGGGAGGEPRPRARPQDGRRLRGGERT